MPGERYVIGIDLASGSDSSVTMTVSSSSGIYTVSDISFGQRPSDEPPFPGAIDTELVPAPPMLPAPAACEMKEE